MCGGFIPYRALETGHGILHNRGVSNEEAQLPMIHKAKDLSPQQKLALESLLGRAISEQEAISIRTLEAPPEMSPERRREILDSLEAHFLRVDAQRMPVSGAEADGIIDEALRSTRPGYRPVR